MKKMLIILLVALCITGGVCGKQTALASEDMSGWSVKMDKTYLEKAVVSDTPIQLTADVRNVQNRRVYGIDVNYEIISGDENAEIADENTLLVKKAGVFVIKATLADDASVFEEYECRAYDFTFSNLSLVNQFENVTVYTQPMLLVSSMDIESEVLPETIHSKVVYQVVSGPAVIYGDEYLKITGTGEVTLQATSYFDDSLTIRHTFIVTDPDADFVVSDLDEALKTGNGGNYVLPITIASCVSAVILLAIIGFVLWKRHSAKHNKTTQ